MTKTFNNLKQLPIRLKISEEVVQRSVIKKNVIYSGCQGPLWLSVAISLKEKI